MCNTAKGIWKTLLITHQGNSQVKDNKIDLLVQQNEQFVIFEDESIDSAFARFKTIITSLKALDEGYSSKNYFIGNLKVHETIIKKDSEIVKAKVERKSLALKAKKESSKEECSTFWLCEDKSIRLRVRDFKTFLRRDADDPNHILENDQSQPRGQDQRAFVGGSWSDSGEENDEKIQDDTCLVAQAPNEGEQVMRVSDKNNKEASISKEKPQEELVLAPTAWRLYVGREPSKEGSGVGMILVSPEKKVYSYAIRLNFYASEDSMDYEALLAGLVAFAESGMKDLHVFVGSKLLID
ncbi:hypothetical protein Tco_0729931 [Tanacetum coccineum]|uniref:RNase H type-1 domain-containing protein n=1 Tax=Tanacetum coccineum TaxID=301880 RepID=A0ABQ4YSS6_9ASTR